MTNRIIELDALRGIAAIFVLIYHYTYRYNSLYGHSGILEELGFYWGKQGVQLFFMISGFVIFLSLNHLKKPMDFIVSRFSRLYPPFWIAIACTFLVVHLFGLPGREVSILVALKNLIMFHGYFDVPDVDGVYWTLQVELTFYFWMFIAYLFKAFRKIDFFIVGFILINLFIEAFKINIHPHLREFLLFNYLPFFGIGICLYKIHFKKSNLLTLATLFLCITSTSILSTPKLTLLYIAFTAIFYYGIKCKITFLSNRILIFIGAISYSLYLLHQNIGYVLINKGYELGINPIISISAAVIIVFILSYLIRILIEVPSSRLIKNFYKKFNS